MLGPVLLLADCATMAVGYDVEKIPETRSVSNYLFGEDALDLDAWAKDLDELQAMGFNTVWNVNVWAAYQPDADGKKGPGLLRPRTAPRRPNASPSLRNAASTSTPPSARS